MAEVFGILFLTICAPLWIIFHYITKWKSSKTLTSEDEQILGDLYDSAEKIESRLNNIERILDAESPDWRTK
ncbi:envelope stress response membrane protein PspB [Emcibacter sp.]|uniref:envelope stress response membrane protein PspB n=1 Tax=Emcibacter sp. TaxID=1979954 RepID=UPI003A90DB1C